MAFDIKSVDEDVSQMFKWSMDIMFTTSKIWIYPVIVALINGLITVGMSWYIYSIGFAFAFIFPLLSMLNFLIGIALTIIIFFLTLMSVKMFIQVFNGEPVDFDIAKEDVLSSAIPYLIVGILAAILSIFIITIPIALLIISTSVIIGADDIGRVFSVSIDILTKNLVPVIVLSLIAIIFGFALNIMSAGPFFFGAVLLSPLTTFVDILILGALTYLSLKALESKESEESM